MTDDPGYKGRSDGQSNGFQLNRPTVISLLYLGSFLAGITTIIGIILAYVWNGEAHEVWEDSHYRYHIRTFWIGIAWTLVAITGSIVTFGMASFILFPLVAVWFVVRAIKSLLAAQKQEPVRNVESWIF